MQLNPSEISELIKSKIQNLQGASEVRTQGTVVSVTDGICRLHGLQDVMPVSYTHLDVYKRQSLYCACQGNSRKGRLMIKKKGLGRGLDALLSGNDKPHGDEQRSLPCLLYTSRCV